MGSFGYMPFVALSCFCLILSLYKVNAQSTFSENLEITLTATPGIAEMTGIQITIPEQMETVTQMQMITVTQTQLQTVIVTANGNCAAATGLLSDGASVTDSSVPTMDIASAAPLSQSSAKASTVVSATALPAQAGPLLAADSTDGCPCACMCPSAAFGMMSGNGSVAAAVPVIEPITTLKTVISTIGADEQPLSSTAMSSASASSVISASTMAISSISTSSTSGSAFSSQIMASLLSSDSSLASSTSQNANEQASSAGSSVSFDIRTFSLLSAITVPLTFPAATPTTG